ncbi:MAG TPA: SDR family NAD(P)-dependent oxidoreductase, partial [Burkholderiaceae bacterium]|nr:SDR family NAD(P)-dependent oxidoreductase [Burkholderiaceae bacterium]
TLDALCDVLLGELADGAAPPVVACRPMRCVPAFAQVRINPAGPRMQRVRAGGVYLITGGLGGIGLVLAQYLAAQAPVKLVLLGRSVLPARAAWPGLLARDPDAPLARKVRAIQALEGAGADVMLLDADVADRTRMEQVAREVRAGFGSVNGIVHAAGVAGGGLIALKTPEDAARVMAPKTQGMRVLAAVFADAPLDFVVLCSSLSAQLGGVGQIDYCAANCYLDAFAWQNPWRARGVAVISIDWDTWGEVGMAVETRVPEDLRAQQQEALRRGIRNAEGVAAFDIVISDNQPQVALSTVPLALRQAAAVRARAGAAGAQPAPQARAHPRPALSTEHVAPRTNTERQVAAIWSQVLGIADVGVDDNFLELGGHSLLAVQLLSRLRDALLAEVPLQTFFAAPTVAAVSTLIDAGASAADPFEAPPLVPLPRERYRQHGEGGSLP